MLEVTHDYKNNKKLAKRYFIVLLMLFYYLLKQDILRENNESHNRGLFLEIVHLLAKYDGILKTHFEDGPRNATYTSMSI